MVRVSRGALAFFMTAVLLATTGCSVEAAQTGSTTPTTPAKNTATFVDYRKTHPEYLTRNHEYGHLAYPVKPPVGGNHNPYWQNCQGDVYPAQIANEHAVHSLEHGAVWITYRPDLPADQVASLAAKVRDRPYLLMSPYPGLDRPISLQAWGYQLKVDSASDPAIVDFIQRYRQVAAPEPGATCGQGITDTGVDALLEEF